MHRSSLVPRALLLGLLLGLRPAFAEPASDPLGVTIDDFAYVDTSGEVIDQVAVHQTRLKAFMAALRHDVATGGGAAIRVIGGIRKSSTLVQWARVAVIDVGSNRILSEKLYTFRGDNDEAWDRAEAFISRDIRAVLTAAAPPPIQIAVFDFELEDMSAAGSATGVAASDMGYLADVTNGVREQLARSGRYHVVETGGTTADVVKKHALRDCGGCDADIARELGADQSLAGVVRRVSRTEYVVRFQIRSARTGAVVSQADSGLRLGADYSWTRGAVSLVRDRVLEGQSRK